MEMLGYVFGAASFMFCILIYCTMPTKRDVRRWLADREGLRAGEHAALFRERIGQTCTLVLAEASVTAGSTRLAGTLRDVDDEWLLMECPGKEGGTQMKALRLELVVSVEE